MCLKNVSTRFEVLYVGFSLIWVLKPLEPHAGFNMPDSPTVLSDTANRILVILFN